MDNTRQDRLLRLDKWLWHARFFKSRTKSTRFCQSCALRVNGDIVSKAHYLVKPNDILTFTIGNSVMVIKILNIGIRRGPSHEARALYDDMSSSTSMSKGIKKSRSFVAQREIGSGRPTKIQRRAIDKLMAKDDQWQ